MRRRGLQYETRQLRLVNSRGPVSAPVTDVQFGCDCDGRPILAAATNTSVVVFDLETATIRYLAHPRRATPRFVQRQGEPSLLVLAERSGIVVLDATTGQRLRSFEFELGSTFDVSFDGDGTPVGVYCVDHRHLRIVSLSDGSLRRSIEISGGSDGGRLAPRIAMACGDPTLGVVAIGGFGQVCVWRVDSGEQTFASDVGTRDIDQVAVGNGQDGQLVGAICRSSDRRWIELWSLADAKMLKVPSLPVNAEVTSLSITGDHGGDPVCSVGGPNRLWAWDARGGELLCEAAGVVLAPMGNHTMVHIWALAGGAGPGGRESVAVGTSDGRVVILPARQLTAPAVSLATGLADIVGLEVVEDANGELVVVTANFGAGTVCCNVTDGRERWSDTEARFPRLAQIPSTGPGGSELVAIGEASLQLRRPSGEAAQVLPIEGRVMRLAGGTSGDGVPVLVATIETPEAGDPPYEFQQIRRIDPSTGDVVWSAPSGNAASSGLVVSPCGRFVMSSSCGTSEWPKVLRMHDGELLHFLRYETRGSQRVVSLAVGEAGDVTFVAAGLSLEERAPSLRSQGSIVIWNATTAEQCLVIDDLEEPSGHLAFITLSNGDLVLASAGSYDVTLWDVATGDLLERVACWSGPVRSLSGFPAAAPKSVSVGTGCGEVMLIQPSAAAVP